VSGKTDWQQLAETLGCVSVMLTIIICATVLTYAAIAS